MSTDQNQDTGFIVVPAWIVTSGWISNNAKLAYLLLAAHSDINCTPGNAEGIAEQLRITPDAFKLAIQDLLQNGAAEEHFSEEFPRGIVTLRGASVGVSE